MQAAEYIDICLLNYWCLHRSVFSVVLRLVLLGCFTGPAAPFSSGSPWFSAFILLPWNCTSPLIDPGLAALIPFPFYLWPFDFHLFRDSCWSSLIFFSSAFSTSSRASHISPLFLNCRLPLSASSSFSSASSAFSLNRIIPSDKIYPFY